MYAMDGRSFLASKRKLHGILARQEGADSRERNSSVIDSYMGRESPISHMDSSLVAAGLTTVLNKPVKKLDPRVQRKDELI